MALAPLLVLLVVTIGGLDANGQTNNAGSPAPETAPATPSSSLNTGKRLLTEIRIEGLHRLDEQTIRSWIKARVGQPYTPDDRLVDIQTLVSKGEFSSVQANEINLSSSTLRLDLVLTELPGATSASTSTVTVASSSSSAPSEHPPVPPPWVIGDIAISGNHHVSYNTLRTDLKVRKGELYERSDLEHDVHTLIGMGSFERVTADVSEIPGTPVPAQFKGVAGSSWTVRLTFMVEEKPTIRKIKYQGNKKISKGRLADQVSLKEKDPLNQVKLREDTDKIIKYYAEKGFSAAKVDPQVAIDTRTASADITFLVDEGPRTTVAGVQLDGLHAFKPRKILKEMTNRYKKIYQEGKLDEDLKKIEAIYKNNGYIDFKISSSTVITSPDRSKVYIILTLDEGHPYRFGTTSFSGYSVYVSSQLYKTLEYKEGKVFNQEKYDDSIHNLQDLYADKGYLRTKITPEKTYNAATDEMDIKFDISEGGIVYVDHVDVEGNVATKTYVLKREIIVKPGEVFSSSRIRKSREKIMNLGFIDDVDVDVQSPSDPSKADLTFGIKEGKPGMLTAGAGFSSVDKLVGTLSLQHMNLFGRAQRAQIAWQFGSRVQDYSLSWTTPWIGDHPTSFGLDLFNTRRISPYQGDINAFVQKRLGGSARLGPRFQDDKYVLNFIYTWQKITITNLDNQFQPGGTFAGTLTEGTSVSSSLGADFSRVTVDNVYDPTKGTKNTLGLSLTGGPLQGDVNLWKPYIAEAAHFHLLSVADYPLVLSFINRASYVTQFGASKEVPVFDRFFVGGQDSLRGYSASGEAGFPNGGKVYDVFNTELGFPLAREHHRSIVKIVGFFDMGSAWDNVKSMRGHIGTGPNDLKTDVGIGLRFVTPAFPIRLDYGWGFNHRSGEKSYQINFGLGPLF